MNDPTAEELATIELCPVCKCCSYFPEICDQCGGDGVADHDCGEDCCVCAEPEDNVPCDRCDGRGAFPKCIGLCDENGHHVVDEVNDDAD